MSPPQLTHHISQQPAAASRHQQQRHRRSRSAATGIAAAAKSISSGAASMSGRQLSGLQREVLALYRAVLRAARTKPPPDAAAVQAYARDAIESQRGVSKTNVLVIEHLLRKGAKQLALLRHPDFGGFSWKGKGSGGS